MRRVAILCLITGTLSGSLSAGETINEKLVHDEQTRSYQVYVPDAYTGSEPWPLVLNLHGAGVGSLQAEISQMNTVADEEHFLVVYPKSKSSEWNVLQLAAGADDLGFIDAMLDAISADFLTDRARVYSTGYSNGGSMSFLLAHELEDRIAAIAPVNGPIPVHDGANNIGPTDPTFAPTSSVQFL